MAERRYMAGTESQADAGSELVVAICVVLLLGVVALFAVFGGPGRFIVGPTPPVTNINAPAQTHPQPSQPHGAPRQIDVNVNQVPGQAPSGH